MKKSSRWEPMLLVFSILLVSLGLVSCKKMENPIRFPQGEFPDSTISISSLNSADDDFNTSLYMLYGNYSIVFSSNRGSSGGQFDLVQGQLSFSWDQTTGVFGLGSEMINDAFLTKLLKAANTTGNDFGPYRLFSNVDGYEYLILSSVNSSGDLDFYYLKNQPSFGTSLPEILGPYPVKLLNTTADDVYIAFDTNQDTAFFSTDTGGDFDIFLVKRAAETDLTTWFNGNYTASTPLDSINSDGDDKCPFYFRKVMVFASNRPGGMGGYDLYYSLYEDGKWRSPRNFGPEINTSSNEYRPVLAPHEDFSNHLMIFSSDKPGGKGGYDLYFRGVSFEGD